MSGSSIAVTSFRAGSEFATNTTCKKESHCSIITSWQKKLILSQNSQTPITLTVLSSIYAQKNHNLLKTTQKKKKNTKLVIFGYGRTGTRSITSTFTLVGKEYMFYFIIINQWARNKCCNSIISTHTVVRSKKN